MKSIVVVIYVLIGLLGCSNVSEFKPSNNSQKSLLVFLVRHAEKVDSSKDPELSITGNKRAILLADLLRSAKIDYIHSTNFIRTKKTATPIAERAGIKLNLYDPHKLRKFAEQLRNTGGRHLVVGHSNTTPSLVKYLGGDPGMEINESSEFDRLYILTVDPHGDVNTVLMRYGNHQALNSDY